MDLNDLDLNKLNTFLRVVEAGGVSKAARRLGRTGSAVSQSLGALESSLGCKLFDRVGKQLVPTRAGQVLHARVAGYQALLAHTLKEISSASSDVSGLVRLGLFLGFPRVQSCALLARFAERYPRASVRVVYAPQHDLETRLRKNQLDFVLSFRPRSAEAPDVTSARLFAEELVLVTGPRFFAGGFSFEELASTPVVDYYQTDPLISRWLGHHLPGQRIEPPVRFWAATTDLVLELVQAGAGVGVLPRYMLPEGARPRSNAVRPRPSSGRARRAARLRPPAPAAPGNGLREVGPSGPPLVDHVWLNEPRSAYRDATQKAFRELLLSVLTPSSG